MNEDMIRLTDVIHNISNRENGTKFVLGFHRNSKSSLFSIHQEMGREKFTSKQWVNGRDKADPNGGSFLHHGPGLAISTMPPILVTTLHCEGLRLLAMISIGMNVWTLLLVSS